jgi:hypothetical protein
VSLTDADRTPKALAAAPTRRPALERVKLAMMSKIRTLKRSIPAILNIAARTHKWGRRGRSGSPERVRPSPPVPARQPSQGVGVCPRRPQSVVRLPLRAIVSQRLASRPARRATPGSFGRKGMEASRAPRSSAARRPPTRKAAIVCRLSCAGPGPFCRHDAQRPGGGSNGAFWRSVWPVRVYRSTTSRPRRRTDSARQRVRLRRRSRRDRSSANGSTRPCARRPWAQPGN